MNKLQKAMKLVIFSLIAAVLLIQAFRAALSIKELYTSYSFRYSQAFLPARILSALDYQETEEGSRYSLTFWGEETGTISSNLASEEVQIVRYLGEANICFSLEYAIGTAPGANDQYGCAVSSEIAWKLFGSTDIVNLTITDGKTDYLIRGVFKSRQNLVIAASQNNEGLNNVELTGAPAGDSLELAQAYVVSAGLGPPDQICYGRTWGEFFTMLCYLPLLITAFLLFWRILKISRLFSPVMKYSLWFLFALLAAVILPYLLSQLPSWLLPSQWSNFGFWSELVSTLNTRLDETFALIPTSKEVWAKRETLWFMLCLAVSFKVFQSAKKLIQ